MAQPLSQRIANALHNPRVRSNDLADLVTEATTERARQTAVLSQASGDSINFGLTEADRDEAAATAERTRRTCLALSAAIEQLEAKRTARAEAEAGRARADARAEILSERDALAQRLAAEWPAIEAAAVDLLSAISASDARMKAAGIHEASAEAVARRCEGNFYRGPVPIRRLVELKLPSFADGANLAWPAPKATGMHWTGQVAAQAAEQRRAHAAEREREAADWAPCIVSAGSCKVITMFRGRAVPKGPEVEFTLEPPLGMHPIDPVECWLRSSEIRRLRGFGIMVEARDAQPA